MTPTAVAVDCLAVARLARLVTEDTFPPVRKARAAWLARWPAPGDVAPDPWTEATTGPVSSGLARLPGGGASPVHQEYVERDDGGEDHRWVWTEGTPQGELVTCPWCASVWLGAGVVALRALVPGLWDPLARALAASEVAGLAAELTP